MAGPGVNQLRGELMPLTITAIPAAGWRFDRWDGSVPSIANPLTVPITSDLNLIAVFSELPPAPTYIISISAQPGGPTDPVPGTYSVDGGTLLSISALPDPGYQFVEWQEGGVSISTINPLVFTAAGDRSLTAVFAAITPPPVVRAVTLDVLGQGTTSPVPGTYPVADGGVFTVSAIAAAGWQFSGWSGDLVSLDNPLAITVTRDLRLTATFTQLPPPPPGSFTVSIAILGLGTTFPARGQYTLEAGTVLTILATPDAGGEFVRWDGDVTGATPLLVVQVNSDLSIVAIFAEVAPTEPPPLPVVPIIIGGVSLLVVFSKLFARPRAR